MISYLYVIVEGFLPNTIKSNCQTDGMVLHPVGDEYSLARAENFIPQREMVQDCLPTPEDGWQRYKYKSDKKLYPYVTISDDQAISYKFCQYAALIILTRYFSIIGGISKDTYNDLSEILGPIPMPIRNLNCPVKRIINFIDLYNYLYDYTLHKRNQFLDYPFSESIILDKEFCPYQLLAQNRRFLFLMMQFKPQFRGISPFEDLTQNFGDNAQLVFIHAKHSYFMKYSVDHSQSEEIVIEPTTYYKSAHSFILKKGLNPVYVAICDDISWCNEYVGFRHYTVLVDSVEHLSELVDYAAGINIVDQSPLVIAGVMRNLHSVIFPVGKKRTPQDLGLECALDGEINLTGIYAYLPLNNTNETTASSPEDSQN